MNAPVFVYCCVCASRWDTRDPRVLYRSADRRWWCRDEEPCTQRARASMTAEEEAAMQRALDDVWAELEARGWKLT